MSHEFVRIARVSDIPPLGGRCVRTPAGPIGVFRTEDDRILAIDNRCPHKGGPLSEGIVHGLQVTCPLHNAVIDLETGAMAGPDEGRVDTIPVRVVDGEIHIGLPEGVMQRHPAAADAGPKPSLAHSAAAVVAEGVSQPMMPNTATRRVAPKENV